MSHHPLLLSFILIFSIILRSTNVSLAGREVPTATAKETDVKHPQFFLDRDGSFLIPGVGRYMPPYTGSFPTVDGYGGTIPRYIPGGDDTFVPNPGVEIPIPGSRGVAAAAP
ncbi:cell wall protein precursor [Tasmannia lanceolata]|uniref:cell wall protein precursor n=1 Tax=Tasmannia lanceolata TaxID=3420 RepID=UPI004062A6FB